MSSKTQNDNNAFGRLYGLLSMCFSDYRGNGGTLAIPKLAKAMGFAHETLYRAVRGDRGEENPVFPDGMLKVPVALRIIEFSRENHPTHPLTWDDLAEFILPHFVEYNAPVEDDYDELLD